MQIVFIPMSLKLNLDADAYEQLEIDCAAFILNNPNLLGSPVTIESGDYVFQGSYSNDEFKFNLVLTKEKFEKTKERAEDLHVALKQDEKRKDDLDKKIEAARQEQAVKAELQRQEQAKERIDQRAKESEERFKKNKEEALRKAEAESIAIAEQGELQRKQLEEQHKKDQEREKNIAANKERVKKEEEEKAETRRKEADAANKKRLEEIEVNNKKEKEEQEITDIIMTAKSEGRLRQKGQTFNFKTKEGKKTVDKEIKGIEEFRALIKANKDLII